MWDAEMSISACSDLAKIDRLVLPTFGLSFRGMHHIMGWDEIRRWDSL